MRLIARQQGSSRVLRKRRNEEKDKDEERGSKDWVESREHSRFGKRQFVVSGRVP